MKKPFVIYISNVRKSRFVFLHRETKIPRTISANGERVNRIVRTDYVNNARGFETLEEAEEYRKYLTANYFRLDFGVFNREKQEVA